MPGFRSTPAKCGIHCTAGGDGAEAVPCYLVRYVFRVAITESRIVGLDDTGVTVRHKYRASNGSVRGTCA